MEARERQLFSTILALFLLLLCPGLLLAASYRTPNFVVTAHTPEFAKQVGDEAERFRKELAVLWAGKALPNWSAPCPIQVQISRGAGGATTFSFHNGEVFGWKMNVQGSEERILDSVLPHEITHTILACRFRRPLPRWADEGVCTLVEHESERRRQTLLLGDVMRGGTKIPLRTLLAMTEYPPDMRDVMKLYAQGYSLTDYLVQQGGREAFLQFLGDAMRHGGWDQALSAHYGVNSIDQLEKKWDQWVIAGSPALSNPEGTQLAVNDRWRQGQGTTSADDPVVRAQSPDRPAVAPGETGLLGNAPLLTEAGSEAPAFQNNAAGRPTASSSAGAATQHQSARSRQELLQPVYSRTLATGSQVVSQESRKELQWTRDAFEPPVTPVARDHVVHPFSGGNEFDPFTN